MPYTDDDIDNISVFFETLCEIIPLGNWRTTLKLSDNKDMIHHSDNPNHDDYGSVEMHRESAIADIYLNVDHDPINEYERWETTVLHELVHVVMDDLAEYVESKHPKLLKDEMYYIKMERTVNVIAHALFNSLAVGAMNPKNDTNELDVHTKHNSEVQ